MAEIYSPVDVHATMLFCDQLEHVKELWVYGRFSSLNRFASSTWQPVGSDRHENLRQRAMRQTHYAMKWSKHECHPPLPESFSGILIPGNRFIFYNKGHILAEKGVN